MKLFFLSFFLFAFCLCAQEPIAVYSTIQGNPDTEITIAWVIAGSGPKKLLKYRESSLAQWYEVEVEPSSFPEKLPYTLYVVELSDLKPESRYEFLIPDEEKARGFKTFPSTLCRPVKFVAGGDIYHDKIAVVEGMSRIAAAQDPDFALLGGDIAYSGSKIILFREEGERWIQFLKSWSETMVRKDGTTIPMIAAIGNHDINGRYDQDPSYAPFYYFIFPTHSQTGYQVIDFGDYMSIWVLDSGHAAPVDGKQTAWLEKTLIEKDKVPFKFALYHVPAYPSARASDNKRSLKVRTHWSPLFEKLGMKAAFENHDHAYKRTHLIKNGKVAENGMLYIGDGAWGVEDLRLPKTPKQRWYIANSAQKRHVILATVFEKHLTVEAIDSNGEIFDSFKF